MLINIFTEFCLFITQVGHTLNIKCILKVFFTPDPARDGTARCVAAPHGTVRRRRRRFHAEIFHMHCIALRRHAAPQRNACPCPCRVCRIRCERTFMRVNASRERIFPPTPWIQLLFFYRSRSDERLNWPCSSYDLSAEAE